MKRVRHALLAGCAAVAIAAGAFAASPDSGTDAGAPVKAPHGWGGPHHQGPGGGLPFMGALKKLNLTAEQQQSIHGILGASKPQRESLREQEHANLAALATTMPDDPNYATLVQTQKTLAGNAIQLRSDLAVQLFAVLTPQQKAQLPQILADAKAKMQERRQQWRDNHPASPAAS